MYEVVNGNALVTSPLDIPATISYVEPAGGGSAPGVEIGTGLVTFSLGPVSDVSSASATEPVPRFLARTAQQPFVTVDPCIPISTSLNLPSQVSLTVTAGGGPVRRDIAVTSAARVAGLATQVSAPGGWLTATLESGSTPADLIANVNPDGLSPGVYASTIQVRSPYAINSPVSVPVTLTVLAIDAQPRISGQGMVNAASNRSGPVSPGMAMTVYGSGFGPDSLNGPLTTDTNVLTTLLAGVRVLFDGTPGAILYAAKDQVGVIAPYFSPWTKSTQVVVENLGVRSAPVLLPVAPTTPGIFLADATGLAAATNQDGTGNSASHPAPVASVVTFYVTGEGQTDPPGVPGKLALSNPPPKPLSPIAVFLGGSLCTLNYFGGVPLSTSGLMQVNAVVPSGLPAGPNTLGLFTSTAQAQGGVILYVK